jgi:hypothetical protein
MSKQNKPFVKITIEDLNLAKDFFDNTNDYIQWLYAVSEYYQGNEVQIKKKIVQKYFNNYKKTMDFIIQAKEVGMSGYLKKIENQEVVIETLEGVVEGVVEPNNKLEINNNKEETKKDKEERKKIKDEEERKKIYLIVKSLDYSNFDFPEYAIEIWTNWIIYKKEQHKDTYANQSTMQIALNKLGELSNFNSKKAEQVVNNSIASLYKGLFELKNENKNGNNGTKPLNQQERIDESMRKYLEWSQRKTDF